MKKPDLHEYAMNYLARYNNTEQGLTRVLNAKLRRWAIKAADEGIESGEIESLLQNAQKSIPDIISKVKRLGIINDRVFAEYKIGYLIRSGGSNKMIHMKLQQKGVASTVIESVLNQYQDKDVELLAALIYARKRRIGPFRRIDREFTIEKRQKEQHAFARGGFSFSMVSKVVSMEREEAEEQMEMLRSV